MARSVAFARVPKATAVHQLMQRDLQQPLTERRVALVLVRAFGREHFAAHRLHQVRAGLVTGQSRIEVLANVGAQRGKILLEQVLQIRVARVVGAAHGEKRVQVDAEQGYPKVSDVSDAGDVPGPCVRKAPVRAWLRAMERPADPPLERDPAEGASEGLDEHRGSADVGSEADGTDDPIGPMLVDCMERLSRGEATAIEDLCSTNPEHAAEIRERMGMLMQMGLLEQRASSEQDFPEQLGDFRLRRRLGGGGMGVVYEAEQAPLGRTVALKLIRPEHLYFPRARERFRRETEAVARLQHPSIVSIYTVGEERGIPFFAMEMVRGASLSEVLAFHDKRAPEGLRGSDLRAAVQDAVEHDEDAETDEARELFGGSWVDACVRITLRIGEAVTHAHDRGVLHRDIKPSNIVVTPQARIVLLDFGLASAQTDLRMTTYGTAIGWVLYMAPEQIQGRVEEIDARTDVYALGVTLYELLALQMPYAGKTAEAVRAAILEGAPPALRPRNRRVSRDLENVCLKAISGERARRYTSMQAFTRDLRAVLADEPVSARPPSAFERATRWVQRHPTGTTALVLGTVLVIGLPTTLALQQHAYNAELQKSLDKETLARKAADDARADADVERDRAKLEARDAESVSGFLVELFEAASPSVAQGRKPTAEELLRSGVERIGSQLRDQPELRARMLERMSQSFAGLALYADAQHLAEQALDTRIRLHGHDDRRTLAALVSVGAARRNAGTSDQGIPALIDAVALYECTLGPNAVETAFAKIELATSFTRVSRHGDARQLLDEAAAALDSIGGDTRSMRQSIATTRSALDVATGRSLDVLRGADEALALDAGVSDPLHPTRLQMLSMRALALRDLGRLEEAEYAFSEAMELGRALFGADDTHYAQLLFHFAQLREAQGRVDEAVGLLREAYERQRAAYGIEHPLAAMAVQKLGQALGHAGRVDDACTVLDEALNALRAKRGVRDGRVAVIAWRAAQARADYGETVEAEARLNEIMSLFPRGETLLRPDLLATLGMMLRRDPTRGKAAQEMLREAAPFAKPGEPSVARYGLATIALADGDTAEADAALRELAVGPVQDWTAPAARVLLAQRRIGREAPSIVAKTIESELREVLRALGPAHVEFLDLVERSARAFDASGAPEQAAALRALR